MEEPVEPRDVPAGAKELGVVVDETVRVLSHAFEQLDSLVAAQEAMVCPNASITHCTTCKFTGKLIALHI